jgi:hypothetical protein
MIGNDGNYMLMIQNTVRTLSFHANAQNSPNNASTQKWPKNDLKTPIPIHPYPSLPIPTLVVQ